jgi:hypothetical protein
MNETPETIGLKKLREPFPADWISKLPKPTKRENPKGKCNVCGGYHGLPAIHVDYVGHADLTARLLDVDPLWNWQPMALTPEGIPLISVVNGTASMWIQLTVCGMTRLGVGTCLANKDEVQKELIGDALRNAAMRFGAALDLWSKTERSDTTTTQDAAPARAARRTPPVNPETTPPEQGPPIDVSGQPELMRDAQRRKMMALFNERGFKDRNDRLDYVKDVVQINVATSNELTVEQASKVINALNNLANAEPQS